MIESTRDALFGRRTEARIANDPHANHQIACLLHRIEDFHGIVILATNIRTHLDEAFARRFQSVVLFNIPSFDQRLRLWEDSFNAAHYRRLAARLFWQDTDTLPLDRCSVTYCP